MKEAWTSWINGHLGKTVSDGDNHETALIAGAIYLGLREGLKEGLKEGLSEAGQTLAASLREALKCPICRPADAEGR